MTKAAIQKTLADNPFFSQLDDDAVAFLVDHAKERKLGQGEVIFRHGEHADKFYLVRTGRITVEIPAVYGPSLEIQNLGAGEVLGWSWLIDPYKWDFQARVVEDADLLEFDGAAVLENCEKNHNFGYEILKQFTELMSERLTGARQRMMDSFSPTGFA